MVPLESPAGKLSSWISIDRPISPKSLFHGRCLIYWWLFCIYIRQPHVPKVSLLLLDFTRVSPSFSLLTFLLLNTMMLHIVPLSVGVALGPMASFNQNMRL